MGMFFVQLGSCGAAALVAAVVLSILRDVPLIYAPLVALAVALFALLPFLGMVALLNAVKRTGWIAHTLASAVVAFVVVCGIGMWIGGGAHILLDPSFFRDAWPVVFAGAAAGFTYWLVFRPLRAYVFPAITEPKQTAE